MLTKTNTYLFLIVISLFFIIISPHLFTEGMFMDGILYAAISQNLANDIGSFWHLKFSETFCSSFIGHMPLAMAIESYFFKIFGNSYLIEKIYSLLTFLITGFIIVLQWNLITDNKLKKYSWLVIFLWITIPLVSWASTNNILENTMMIFTSLAVYFSIKKYIKNKNIYTILAGLCIFLAFMSKGITALFPLTIFFWIKLFNKDYKIKTFIIDTLLLIATSIIPLLLCFLIIPTSIVALTKYFDVQIFRSITQVQTVSSHFYILYKLFTELIPILITAILALIIYKIKRKTFCIHNKWFYIFLCIGLSAVLPIMISLKQRGFYILASFPFFSIAFSLIIASIIESIRIDYNQLKHKYLIVKIISMLLLSIALTLNIYFFGKIGRDKEKIQDIKQIISVVTSKHVIGIDKNLIEDWALYAYFQRYGFVSLDANNSDTCIYKLLLKNQPIPDSSNYVITNNNLHIFDLYKRL